MCAHVPTTPDQLRSGKIDPLDQELAVWCHSVLVGPEIKQKGITTAWTGISVRNTTCYLKHYLIEPHHAHASLPSNSAKC